MKHQCSDPLNCYRCTKERKREASPVSAPGSTLSDAELARAYAECGLTGACSEWPQLRPLLGRMAARVETLEKAVRAAANDFDDLGKGNRAFLLRQMIR